MADEDVIVAEVPAEPIENNNPIEDLINSIQNKEYTDAEQTFNDIIGDRLQNALDQTKVRMANQMYNDAEEEYDEEEGDEEMSDNEFDDDFEEEDDES